MSASLAPRIWEIGGSDAGAIALRGPARALTWRELEERTNAIGRGIEALGVAPGSHVVLASTNRTEFIEVLIGAMRAGYVVTPVKTSWTAEELGHVLDDAGTRLVATDLVSAREAARSRGLAVLDFDAGPDGGGYEAWVARQDAGPLPRDRKGMRMSYTSGTTGRPKGVTRLGDRGRPWCEAFAASAAFKDILSIPTNGPHLNVSALFHGAPLAFSLSLLANGAELRILSRWDPAEALAALADGVESTCMVPTMFRQLLALPDDVRARFRAPALRAVLHGGEPCPQPLKRRMIEWWGPRLVEYYGMTEGGLTVATSAEWLARPGTVGRAKLGLGLRILDAEGRERPVGEEGVIYFTHPQGQTFEYRNAPEKTAAAHAAGGAFTVGDVGYVDADGYLFISGRKADVIVSSGVNVYPAEIEDVLFSLPEVRDACVVGAPDEMRGETIAAFVALAEGGASEADALAAIERACEERLAGYKRPRRFVVRDDIPRDGTGKLLRHVLRAELWQGAVSNFAAPSRTTTSSRSSGMRE
jgi:long-chain acyl-CoA synthetase